MDEETPANKAAVARLLTLIGEDTDENALDETVHDLMSAKASTINNGGWQSQIEFIVETLGTAEGEKAVLRALGEWFK